MDLRVEDFDLPLNQTTIHLCKMFNISELLPPDEKNETLQITGMSAILTSKRVHHIALSGCIPGTSLNKTWLCSAEMNKNCSYLLGGYAPGVLDFNYPKEGGVPFGVGNYEVLIMQIHYHNPVGNDFPDTSGLRVSYSDQPRPYIIASTFLGRDTYSFSIPPNEKNFTIKDTCNTTCTNMLNPEGFNIIGALLHGHWFLKKVKLIINFADGRVDNTTFVDNYYDFNSQFFKIIPNAINIKPGDSMTTICEYDTSKSNSTVYGGPGSDNEMCLILLFYYDAKEGFTSCGETLGCNLYNSTLSEPNERTRNLFLNYPLH